MHRTTRWSRRLAGLLASALILLAAMPVNAASQPPYLDAMETLQAFGIVQGDAGSGLLRLNDPITRAETVKILVVAAGKADAARLLEGTSPFSDVQPGQWWTGWIAYSKQAGMVEGYPDGTFLPRAQVKYSEVLALLVRLVGLRPKSELSWPMNYLQAAIDAGIITESDSSVIAGVLNQPATRGPVFTLAHNALFNVRGADGRNMYARNFDSQKPVVQATAEVLTPSPLKVRVTGTVSDNVGLHRVTVAETAVTVGADGRFSVELSAPASPIAVEAVDAAGNSHQVSVGFTVPPAVTIKSLTVNPTQVTIGPGEQARLTATAIDSTGQERQVAVRWCLVGGSGGTAGCPTTGGIAVDTSTGAVVGSLPGKYRVRAEAEGRTAFADVWVYGPVSTLQIQGPSTLVANTTTKAQFTVQAADNLGIPVPTYARPITLTTGTAGLEIQPVGSPSQGMARFEVRTLDTELAGAIVSLKAQSVDGTSTYSNTRELSIIGQSASDVRIEAPAYLPANTSSDYVRVRAYVVDQAGEPMLTGTWTVLFTVVSGPATLAGPSAKELFRDYIGSSTPVAAEVMVYAQKGETGQIQIAAAVDDVGDDVATLQATIASQASAFTVTAAPAQVRAAQLDWAVVRFQAVDSKGVPVAPPGTVAAKFAVDSAAAPELEVSLYDPTTESWDSPETLSGANPVVTLKVDNSGSGQFRVRAWKFTGSLGVTVTGDFMTAAAASLRFIPGPAAQVGFTSPGVVVGVASPQATLRAQAYDVAGNAAPQSGVTVRFSSADTRMRLHSKTGEVTVKSDSGGVASVEVYNPYVGTYSVTMSSTDLTVMSGRDTAYFQVVSVLPKSVTVEFRDSSDTKRSGIIAGDIVTLRVTLTDADNFGLPGFASLLSARVAAGTLVNPNIAFTDVGKGVYEASIQPTQAPSLSVEVTLDTGVVELVGSGSLSVRAGSAARVRLQRAKDDDPVEVKSDTSAGPFLVQVTDLWGNAVGAPVAMTIQISSTGVDGALNVRLSPSGTSITEFTIGLGSRGVPIYIVTTDPDTFTLILDAPDPYGDDSITVQVR